MRAARCWAVAVVLGVSACAGGRAADAADAEGSITVVPMRYIAVDGDAGKFRAHHWMNDGYAGGIKDASGHFTSPDGIEVSGAGHALIGANDFGAELAIKKEDVGFFDFGYSEFRKYFDNGAGAHRRFATFQLPTTDKDLRLDIGKFGFETGLTLEGWPELALEYEREFKEGAKSRLTWTSVKEVGEARNIGPSWQEVNETVDSFVVKAKKDDLAGFNVHGEQRWEFTRIETLREERYLANTGVASDTKVRQQNQGPQAILLATTLGGERSFLEDKVLMSSGYHFNHLKNRETETMTETNAAGVITNFSRGENKINARADNDYDSHAWVQHVTFNPWQTVSFGAKLKSEVITRHGNSVYPWYSEYVSSPEAFDQVMDHQEVTLADAKTARWGEGLSLRFTGVPRTALYTELEFEQSRMLLREDRQSLDGPDTGNDAVATEVFTRETVTHVQRSAWTLGGRTNPWPFLDLTSQVRHRVHNNDYDDQRETVASGARSAFFDGQSTHTDEFSTRITLKPCRWFRPSFRYQLRADTYATRAESQSIAKTGSLSNIYTFDVMLQPARDLVTTATFSRQTASMTTPARLTSMNPGSNLPVYTIPAFNADVNTWMFGADYAFKPNVMLNGTMQYSWAENFNDFANTAMPYGADFHKLDLTTGVKWSPVKLQDTSVGAEYNLYTYNPNENVEGGEYTAHVLWFEVSQKF
ncbi:MAG: hypothetical protein HYY15_03155 [Candidatus Omnitrophica bacterium]|nr:hypothetical protein [Candidatus Omnitrophota bacterium]